MVAFSTRFGLLRSTQVSSVDRPSHYRRDLRTSGAGEGGAGPPEPDSPQRVPVPVRHRRGLVGASVFVLLGAAILLVAAFSGWWSLTTNTSGGPVRSETFSPGGNYAVSCSGSGCGTTTGTFAYASEGLGAVGELYGAAQVLLLIAGALAVLTALLGFLGAFRYGFPRRRFLLCCFALLVAFGLALAALVAVSAFQTAALAQDGGGIPSAAPSPVTSFWGSCSANAGGSNGMCQSPLSGAAVTDSWGPTIGWALALVGLLFLLVGLWALFRTRPTRLAVRGFSAP